MTDSRAGDRRVVELLDVAWDHSRLSLRSRWGRVSGTTFLLVQSALAAGVAWWLASSVFAHETPLFAPIVAVVCLGMSYGQPLRRIVEVAIGVAVGVLVADVFGPEHRRRHARGHAGSGLHAVDRRVDRGRGGPRGRDGRPAGPAAAPAGRGGPGGPEDRRAAAAGGLECGRR